MYNFCSASECGNTAPVYTVVISGDEAGSSSSEEDVLVDMMTNRNCHDLVVSLVNNCDIFINNGYRKS